MPLVALAAVGWGDGVVIHAGFTMSGQIVFFGWIWISVTLAWSVPYFFFWLCLRRYIVTAAGRAICDGRGCLACGLRNHCLEVLAVCSIGHGSAQYGRELRRSGSGGNGRCGSRNIGEHSVGYNRGDAEDCKLEAVVES